MRLGGYYNAKSREELEPLCERLDELGLSAISAPREMECWADDECHAFGERARELGLVIGEVGFWESLLDPDRDRVVNRIENIRTLLRKADIMGVACVVTLVGSRDTSSALSIDPYNFSAKARMAARENCLRIVDGLDLKTTRYVIEPWVNSFFWEPDDIYEFLKSVDDPRVGLHMDQMNMLTPATYYRSTEIINHSFDLLAPYIASVHAKDILWSTGKRQNVLQLDEVYVGDGVMDYDTYLKRLNALDPDMPVYTEHWATESEYVTALERLHAAARHAGTPFLRRGE